MQLCYCYSVTIFCESMKRFLHCISWLSSVQFFLLHFFSKKRFTLTFLCSHSLIFQKTIAMRYHHCERVATLPRSVWPSCCVSWTASIILSIARQKLWLKFLFVIVDILLCYKYKKWKRKCSYLVSHLRNNVAENCQEYFSSSKSLRFLLHSVLSRSFWVAKSIFQHVLSVRHFVAKPNTDGLCL